MGVGVVTGPEWRLFTAGCKAAGDGGLMREVRKEIRDSAKAAGEAVKAHTGEYMPKRYAADVSATLKITTSATMTGVTVKGRAKTAGGKSRELAKLDAGMFRHPLWGRWHVGKYMQAAKRPGFWSEPLKERSYVIGRAVRDAMDRVAQRIAG